MSLSFIAVVVLALGLPSAKAMTAAEIVLEVQEALTKPYAHSTEAKGLPTMTKGILVFPNVYKAGFIVGGQFGEGALLKDGKTVGYCNPVEVSYGLQVGIQSFGCVLFFLQDEALEFLDHSKG